MAPSAAKRRVESPSRPLIDKAVRSILARQLPDGGFNIYAKGPSELNATVKAYTALKLAGLAYDDPNLSRARERILALGGLQKANSYVKINLSLFGLYPREHTPSIAPEFMLLGNFIYEMSSWTRDRIPPLSIVHALNPRRPVPEGFTLNELVLPGVPFEFPNDEGFFSWRNFFIKSEKFLKFWERHGSRSLRHRAIRRAERWMLERTRYTDGVAAIYPPMMYVIMALDLLGYPKDHPDVVEAEQQFLNLLVDDHRGFFFQPCFSVVWDTAIVAYVLGESGLAPACAHQLRRLALTKEVRRKGLVGEAPGTSSPPAGTLSSPTSFIPISTIRRRFFSPCNTSGPASNGSSHEAWRGGARSTGCSPCSRRTAAGRLSMSIITGKR